jgi:hypothetical protein
MFVVLASLKRGGLLGFSLLELAAGSQSFLVSHSVADLDSWRQLVGGSSLTNAEDSLTSRTEQFSTTRSSIGIPPKARSSKD